jgi:hypothetical protein
VKLANSQKIGSLWLTVMLVLTMLMSMVQVGSIPGVDVMQVAKANTPTPTVTSTSPSILTMNIGDYIQFGKYNNIPILWRVIHKDANGDSVLFADRILTIKAFDARGSYHSEYYRKQYGSNDYSGSNIRQWLNSSSPNSGTNRIDWIQNDPSKANMEINPYDTEKGFLANGNFTSAERSLLQPFTHKVLLAGVDAAKRDGGTANHYWSSDISTIVQNYDSAYYKNVTDQVFLLSVKQLKEWVYNRGWPITAKPTSAAIAQSTYKDATNLNSESNWYYWLNSPRVGNSVGVRTAYLDGYVYDRTAHYYGLGVRPALLLNLKSSNFKSGGIGSVSNPYVVTTTNDSDLANDTQAPNAPSLLGANSVSPTGMKITWKPATDNVGVIGYEVYRDGLLVKTLPANATTWSVSGLRAGTTYTFMIRARDAAGNQSNGNSNGSTILVKTHSTISIVGKTITVNGNTLNLGAGVEPATINGSIMVPFRPIFEALGLSVSYNATTKAIEGTRSGYKLSMKMKSRTATVNGKVNKTMPVAPTTIKGITMVPLRFIADELGVVLTYRSK